MIERPPFSDAELAYFWEISAAEAKRVADLCFHRPCLAKADFIRRETKRLYDQRTKP